jgi:alpha-glucosidase
MRRQRAQVLEPYSTRFDIMPRFLGRRAHMWKKMLFLYLIILCFCRAVLGQSGWQAVGNVSAVKELPNGVELAAGKVGTRILALSPTVIRLLYTPDGKFLADHSFAVLPNAFPPPPNIKIQQGQESVILNTGALQVRINRSPLRVSFLDLTGREISQDSPGDAVWFNGNAFRVWKSMPEDEHYFGLGDKTGPLDHRNLAFTLWNTDMFGWQESTDPLYKAIPFLVGVRNGVSYGLFLDNTYRTSFDFGKASRDSYSFGADGGPLDYYFFYGPDPKKVVQDFTALVGRPPLPPLFALGYQQSRYTYFPESQVRDIAAEFRKRQIPADVIYLDIDYQQDNRPFTIDRARFPNFEGMVKDLKEEGFKLVLITDLHIAKQPGYNPYDEGMAHNYFVKNPDGSVYVGKVWPGDSVFPDFTRAEVRKWWGSLYTEFVKMGVRGFWNDMNEPSIFLRLDKTMPLDTVHSVEGRKTDHREIHNVYGMENVRATHDGLISLQPDVRPFVLTRAAYAGSERFAATWTGDNTSSWNHLRISIPQMLNLGLSGYAFVGDDVGGFRGGPTPELLTRWIELGTFTPFFRNHGGKETRNREPWVDGPEHEAIRKKYIETRYRLLPYLYTSMEESSRTGLPLMRPMFLDFPDDPGLATADEEYMFGENFLVVPRVWEFPAPYEVTLPRGDWYNYWTGEKLTGGEKLTVDPPLDTLPIFVRGGAIVPEQPAVQHVEETPQGPLELRVYPGTDCRGELYVDDGNTFAYQHGAFMRMNFTCEISPGHVDVKMSAPEGPYQPWFKEVQIVVYGAARNVQQVSLDGQKISNWKGEGNTVTIGRFPWAAGAHAVRLDYAAK